MAQSHLLVHVTLLGTAPIRDEWCPDCLKSSLVRFVFAMAYGSRSPSGVNCSAPVCQDCGRVGL